VLTERVAELETDVNNLQTKIKEFEDKEKKQEELLQQQQQQEEQKQKTENTNEQEIKESDVYDPDVKFIPAEVRKIMEDIKNKGKDDPLFAQKSRATSWTIKEVAYWLETIDFATYIPTFLQNRIDGEILIRDLDKHTLSTELQVLSSHASKLLREIAKLKSMLPEQYSISEIVHLSYVPNVNLQNEINKYQQEIVELKKKNIEKITKENDELKAKPQIPKDHIMVKEEEKKK